MDFCVFKQTFPSGGHFIKYGKIKRAYIPLLNYDPATIRVDILHKCPTLGAARKLWEKYVNATPVTVVGPLGDRVYRSVEDAALATGVHPRNVIGCMGLRRGYEKPKGFRFYRISKEIAEFMTWDDPVADFAALPPPPPKIKVMRRGGGRRVRRGL